MKYSRRFKESVLKKVLPPENRSVPEVAREMGLSDQTIYNWKKMLEKGNLLLEEESSPSSIGRIEKFNLLLEGKTITEGESGKWLREKGLHSEHLNLWEQEFKDILKDKETELKQENTRLKKEKKELERATPQRESSCRSCGTIDS